MKIMVEALRSLVALHGWDYCILWKLSHGNRVLEWAGCCCGGKEKGGLYQRSDASGEREPCRDDSSPHLRTRACEELAGFPSSILLDSSLPYLLPSFRDHAEALVSNQPSWQIHAIDSSASVEKETVKTRVLVPVPAGALVELFAWKHMAEDQHTIDFIISQHNLSVSLAGGGSQELEAGAACDYLPATSTENQPLPWDITAADQFRLYASSLNLFSCERAAGAGAEAFFEGSTADSFLPGKPPEFLAAYEQPGQMAARPASRAREAAGVERDGVRADSGFDGSDQGEEEDEQRQDGRGGGKRHHAKNLHAERKRRKKLNDSLYALRALVPNISKMDRAAILGDAIEYVMKLQKEIKELQDELEENSPHGDDAAKQMGSNNNSNCQLEVSNPNADSLNSSKMTVAAPAAAKGHAEGRKHGAAAAADEKGPQMEPHVEVRPVEGNKFFLEVLCEQKPGGFVRLMEAMSSLGLEVTNVNVTTFKPLVLNVFRVEKRDNEGMQAEQLRDSLLEVTRDAGGDWPEMIGDDLARDFCRHDDRVLARVERAS